MAWSSGLADQEGGQPRSGESETSTETITFTERIQFLQGEVSLSAGVERRGLRTRSFYMSEHHSGPGS